MRPRAPAAPLTVELALVGLTVAVVLGFGRLLAGATAVVVLLVLGGSAHVAVHVVRRRGLPTPAALLVGLGVAVPALLAGAAAVRVDAGGRALVGLGQLRDELARAASLTGSTSGAVELLPGHVLTLGTVVWTAVWLADLAAFRLGSPAEAVVPSGAAFVLTSLVTDGDGAAAAALLWAATATAVVLVHRTWRTRAEGTWLGGDADRGATWALRTGGTVLLVGAVLAVLAAPLVPGASAPALVSFRPAEPGTPAPGEPSRDGPPESSGAQEAGPLPPAGTGSGDEQPPSPEPEQQAGAEDGAQDGGEASSAAAARDLLLRAVLLVVLLVAGLLVAVLAVRAAAAGLRVALRCRRRARARSDAQQIAVAWREIGDELTHLRLPRRPAETPQAYARRMAASGMPDVGPAAALVSGLAYGPGAPRQGSGTRALACADAVRLEARARRGRVPRRSRPARSVLGTGVPGAGEP